MKITIICAFLLLAVSCIDIGDYWEQPIMKEEDFIREMIDYALRTKHIEKEFNSNKYNLEEIEMHETQVVKGRNHRITIRMNHV